MRAVKSCDLIVSSSLHGLICADAYGVPNEWIQLSDDLIGGNFKFRDHMLSLGANDPERGSHTDHLSLSQVASRARLHTLDIDLKELMLACPFLCNKLRQEIHSAVAESCGLPISFNSIAVAESIVNSAFE